MSFYADLHVHSKYSRATSRNCDLEHLAWWARRKGITVVGTGDFTHPAWFDEVREKLVSAEPGLFRLRPDLEREIERRLPPSCRGPVRFMLEVEISTIYKKGDRTRKIHHLVYAAHLETAQRFRESLGRIGNLASDGRPILGLDSRDLLEITLESGPDAYLVPAHLWTPWFAVLGSKSGFDSVEECYGDLAHHIFAVETGLSSDPPMNWRVSQLDGYTLVSNSDAHSPPMLGREACVFDTELDYFAMRRALETGAGFDGTVEFFPEEGKYHLDGHRGCGLRLEPRETRRHRGRCPACGKPLTVGVMHRIETLADRPEGVRPDGSAPFRNLVPLPEIMAELYSVGAKSKKVESAVSGLVSRLGPEIELLEQVPLEEIARSNDQLLVEALTRLRAGRVRCEAGFDGEYGVIRLFEPGELERTTSAGLLFEPSELPAVETADRPSSEAPTGESFSTVSITEIGDPTETGGGRHDPPYPGSVLSRLDADQRSAAETIDRPLLVLAGPGSGKTRTLTHRLAYLIAERKAPPEGCLAITFTRRAAGEMRKRLRQLVGEAAARITVTTFHGLGYAIVREQAAALELPPGLRVADAEECLEVVADLYGTRSGKADLLLDELRQRRCDGLTKARCETDGRVAAYRRELRRRGLVDYDDLLILPLQLFEDRSDLAERYRQRYPWVSIDEYQDIDALQYRLVRHLAPPSACLCAIGDPDQSIYRFRGADVGFFLRFGEDYPTARVCHLHRSYRSTSVILEAARQAIMPVSLVEDRRLTAVSTEDGERIVLHAAPSVRAEADFVVRAVERLLGGTSYFSFDSGRVGLDDTRALSFDDFAVLYRMDSQADALLEAFGRAGIPVQKRSHRRWTERPGVQRLVGRLREVAAGPSIGEFDSSVEGCLVRALEIIDAERSSDEMENRVAFQLLRPLAVAYRDDLDGFLAEVALGGEVDTWDPRAERVSLLTLHAAKGLEFEVVFIVGCEDGVLPHRRADTTQADLDEERRLFFVGLTRARSRLFLSRARRRQLHGRPRETEPSPFLDDIAESLVDRARARTTAPSNPQRQLSLFRGRSEGPAGKLPK